VTVRVPALVVSVLVACSSRAPDEPSARSRDAASTRTLEVTARDLPTDTDIDAGAAAIDAGAAVPAERLKVGRELAQQEKWRDALAALEQAAAAGDPAALAEVAFTAAVAGDDVRAEAAGRALVARPDLDDAVRATAYFHLGRAAELRGDLEAARTAYEQSLALQRSGATSDRLAHLAPRPPPPLPPAPPCAESRAVGELCACLATALAPRASARCVTSHRHGGDAWALTLVARDQAPTFLVAGAKGQARVVAALGAPTPGVDAELTIRRWNVLRGPAGAALIRVDTRMSGRDAAGRASTLREDALLCTTGAAPRCLAQLPLVERVGTPAVTRQLDVAIDATDERGVARVTLVEGPATPADLLGAHRLW